MYSFLWSPFSIIHTFLSANRFLIYLAGCHFSWRQRLLEFIRVFRIICNFLDFRLYGDFKDFLELYFWIKFFFGFCLDPLALKGWSYKDWASCVCVRAGVFHKMRSNDFYNFWHIDNTHNMAKPDFPEILLFAKKSTKTKIRSDSLKISGDGILFKMY